MEIDNQTPGGTLELKDILGNHGHQALAAVVSDNRHHVLSPIPERARDPAEALAIGLECLAADMSST
jgi:hypothetical protein